MKEQEKILLLLIGIFSVIYYMKFYNKKETFNFDKIKPTRERQARIPRPVPLKNLSKNETYYVPEYVKKDTMNPNPIGSSELYFTGDLDASSYKAWSDSNLSQYPDYYKSDFKNENLGMKQFFDTTKGMQTVSLDEKSKSNTILRDPSDNLPNALPSDACYPDVNNVNVCDFKGKLKRTPRSLYNVGKNGESVIQPIVGRMLARIDGDIYNSSMYLSDEPMNGGVIYDRVRGIGFIEDTPSPIINEQITY